MNDWNVEKDKKEMVKRIRTQLSTNDTLELVFSSEELLREGRFPKNALGAITRLEEVIRKIKHGHKIKP
tara:strand:+ start:8074 stop:8280 length:207 start_codon:yes stop_codon:yes gene_type:complete